MKKNYVGPLILIGLILSIAYFTMQSGNDYRTIREKGNFDTCTVKTYGGDVICSFTIQGRDLTKRLSKPHESIRDGEMFNVYYYNEIPGKYFVAFQEPIIIDSDFGKTSTSELERKGDYILFHYEVDGKPMKRYQELPEGLKINNNMIYQIKYKISNPKIAYLIL